MTRLRRLRSDDTGISLVELLVGMVLMSIVGVMMTTAFSAAIRSKLDTDARNINAGILNIAVATTTKALRTAKDPDGASKPLLAFTEAGPTEVTFHAALGNTTDTEVNGLFVDQVPSEIRYWLDGTDLRERVRDGVRSATGDVTYPGPGRTRVVATDVVPGTPIFTYYEAAADLAITAGEQQFPRIPPGAPQDNFSPLDEVARKRIGSIEVRLTVRSDPNRRETEMVSRVTLLN